MLLHLQGGTKDRAVAAENDGHIGRFFGEVFFVLEVGQNDFEVLIDRRAEALDFFQEAWALACREKVGARTGGL
jgi:hypothetical protein